MNMPSKLIATLTLATVAVLAGCSDKSPEGRIQAAKKALQAADYKSATIELKNALQSAPGNVEARLLLGQSLQAQEQWADSEKELRKALELGATQELALPSLMHTLVRLSRFQEAVDLNIPKAGLGSQALATLQAERANALMALNKPTEAAQAISEGEQALARAGVKDFSQDLQLAKAVLAFMNKQPSQAMSILEGTLQRDPKFLKALLFKARLLQADRKDAGAIKVYQKILEINPKHFLAHLSIADLYQKEGNIDAADKAVQAVEKIAPGNPMVQYARATIDVRRGNIKKANDAIVNVLQVMPNHLPSLMLEATTNYVLGNYEKSRKSAEYILAQLPTNIHATRLLAANMLKMNNPLGVLNMLVPLADAHKGDAAILAMVGEAYLKTRDYTKAVDYLDRAANLEPKNPAYKSQQATGHWIQGETELAISEMEKATKLSNQPGQADMALVMLQLERRDYDRALQAIAAFEKKLHSNPITHNLRAAAYLGKKNPASARQSLEQALTIDPKFYPAAANLAHLDMLDKNPQAARKRFEGVLAADKNNVPAMLALAELAAAGKQEKEQFDWLDKSIKADAKAIQPRKQMIGYYLARKKNTEALVHAREAVNQNQDLPGALSLLGTTQLAIGDKNAAIATFTRLTTKAPASPEAFYHLALAQLATKEVRAAQASLQQALKIDAGFTQAQTALIQIEMKNARPDSALALARQTQARQPTSSLGFEQEGDIHLAQKRYAPAIKAYQHAVERGTGPAVRIKLHRTLTVSGDNKGAEQYLNGWISQHSADTAVRDYAAAFYLAKGRNRDAIAQYEALLKASPNNAVALNNLATLYQREKDGRAQATAEQALKLRPEQPSMMDTLGWILVEKGQLERAMELLRSAASLAPKAGGTRYHYAVALARAGKKVEARKELEAAIASGEKFPELEEARAMLKSL